MTQPDPFPILNSAGLKEAAADCPLLQGGSDEEWIECCSNRFLGIRSREVMIRVEVEAMVFF